MLALFFAAAITAQSSYDAGIQAYRNIDLPAAKRLLADAAADDADPHRRAEAEIRLAYIAWHIDRDAAAARKWLDAVTDEENIPNAWIERARVDAELLSDFPAARNDAAHALGAPKANDSLRASIVHAGCAIEPALRGLPSDAAQLDAAKKEVRDVIALAGPLLAAARIELDAAVVTNDGATAIEAWRAYYGSLAHDDLLAADDKAIANWSDRRGAGLALVHSGFIREGAYVLKSLSNPDAAVSNALAYAKFVANVKTIADDYYRDVALKHANEKAFRASLEREGETLWRALSMKGAFYSRALIDELGRRFDAIVRIGNTGNILVLHYGHKVSDEQRSVSQFGREAPLRFIVIDGIVSNGFTMWYGPFGGDGGWADEAIYQVRPMYADGPLFEWQRTTNAAMRAERERNATDETARDAGRAALEPVRFFPGVQLRLMRAYDDGVLDEVKSRSAFIARVERDTFESSIWAHEGRHAIDKKVDGSLRPPELEYRAKLSQLQFAPSTRRALIDIGGNGTPEFGDTPHGIANRRVAQAIADWMKAHVDEINGVDRTKPLMLQLDKLSDAQIRAIGRSVDPFAR